MENATTWPGWETVRLIGRGSFGAVYEIERDINGDGDIEKCALKHIQIPQFDSEIREMRSEGSNDLKIANEFTDRAKGIVNEYKMMMRLSDCPNIVTCHDVSRTKRVDGYGWDVLIRMELLTPFDDLLSKNLAIPESEIIKLGIDISNALAACEKYHIVHRDIKPQNIFITRDGRYKLGDFGIARIYEGTGTQTSRIGTYTYMAPEVFNSKRYGTAADIYSLGMVLYWLLNDRKAPFVPENTASQKEKAQERRFGGEAIPAPAHGSKGLKQIVLKACAYDPKDRYQSAAEMLADLERIGGAEQPQATPQYKDSRETTSEPYYEKPQAFDPTVGPFDSSTREDTAEEDETIGAFDKKSHRGSSRDDSNDETTPQNQKSNKRGLPVIAKIGISIIVALLWCYSGLPIYLLPFPFDIPKLSSQEESQIAQDESKTASITTDSSHLSEEQLREIPNWYYDDCVTIKDAQICFSRLNCQMFDDVYIPFVQVYTYDEQGVLYDMRIFDFYPTAEAAEKWYSASLDFSDGKNCHGYTEDEAHYFRMDNILVTVFEEQYYNCQPESQLKTALQSWSDLGWAIRDASDGSTLTDTNTVEDQNQGANELTETMTEDEIGSQSTQPAEQPKNEKPVRANVTLMIGTSDTGGSMYPAGDALSRVWTSNVQGVTSYASTSTGSVQNVKDVASGAVDVALATADSVLDAYNGSGKFADSGRLTNIRVIGAVYTNVLSGIALRSSGIRYVHDLVGKHVAIGPASSITERSALAAFKGMGISSSNCSFENLSIGDGADAVGSGIIDAAFGFAALPIGSQMNLSAAADTVILEMTDEEISAIIGANKSYIRATIPASTYLGMDHDCRSIGLKCVIVVRDDMDEDLAYDLCKAMSENGANMAANNSLLREMKNPSFHCTGMPIALHSGAQRYFKEIGLI